MKLKLFFSKLFTLTYPRYRFFIIFSVLILLRFLPLDFIAKTHNFSICYKLLGDKCYSVGITRGVSSLLKGDFLGATEYNFLSIPVLIILFCFLFYDFFKILNIKK